MDKNINAAELGSGRQVPSPLSLKGNKWETQDPSAGVNDPIKNTHDETHTSNLNNNLSEITNVVITIP